MFNFKIYAVLILFIVDMLALFVSLTVGFELRELINPITATHFKLVFDQNTITSFLTISFAALIGFWIQQIYIRKLGFWEEMRVVIISLVYTAAAVFFAFAVVKVGYDITRLGLIFSFFIATIMLPISKQIAKTKLLNRDIFKEKIIILGNNKNATSTYTTLKNDTYLGYLPLGPVSCSKPQKVRRFARLGIFSIAVCDENLKPAEINELQRYFKNVIIVPRLKDIATPSMEASYFFGEKLFFLTIRNNLRSNFNRGVKRIFDITISILLFPIIMLTTVVLAILIKIDSDGSIFFMQKRLGVNGTSFFVYKFRSMYLNADEILEEYLQKNEDALDDWKKYKKLKGDDPRVTKIGNFIRKLSLDELPQIINVFKGDMSIVGPRPYLPSEVEHLPGSMDYILETKPGITGLWQISGRNELAFSERLNLDNWYVLNWSVWLDIIILLKTFEVVLARKGAY
jgi:Undecaprenyl-phosphate galactose phosphotransferase WbaP